MIKFSIKNIYLGFIQSVNSLFSYQIFIRYVSVWICFDVSKLFSSKINEIVLKIQFNLINCQICRTTSFYWPLHSHLRKLVEPMVADCKTFMCLCIFDTRSLCWPILAQLNHSNEIKTLSLIQHRIHNNTLLTKPFGYFCQYFNYYLSRAWGNSSCIQMY